MFEAWIDNLVLPARRNQRGECPLRSDASCLVLVGRRSKHVFCREHANSIVDGIGRRSSAKNELMGGKAGSLIGLEHVVGEAILRREFEVRIQKASRIVYELELRSDWTGAGAGDIARAIHLAAVKHAEERSMCVAEVIG